MLFFLIPDNSRNKFIQANETLTVYVEDGVAVLPCISADPNFNNPVVHKVDGNVRRRNLLSRRCNHPLIVVFCLCCIPRLANWWATTIRFISAGGRASSWTTFPTLLETTLASRAETTQTRNSFLFKSNVAMVRGKLDLKNTKTWDFNSIFFY